MPELPSTICSSGLWDSIENIARRWNKRKTRELLKNGACLEDLLLMAMRTPQRDEVKTILKQIERSNAR